MYSNLNEALARAKERSGATAVDDVYLTELLTLSAGKDSAETTIYRPFFCAAKWLEQNRSIQGLTEAKGVKFTGQATPIESLLELQASMDKALGLTVPAGFEAISPDCKVCENQTTVASQRRFSTQSLSSRSRP